MEWLLPVLFVVVSLLQWWLKHRQTIKAPSHPEPGSSPQPREITEPLNEIGDLLEALGRGRNDPPPVIPSKPFSRVNESPAILTPPAIPVLSLQPPGIQQAVLDRPSLPRPFSPRSEPINSGHSWRKKLGQPSATKEAIVLAEILALPLSLR